MYPMGDKLLFSEWLVDQMRQRNWSQADLANAAGIGRGVINKIINQINKQPDPKTCVAIARGLKMSPITVFIAAGLLPPLPDRSSQIDDLECLVSKMSVERREILLTIARALFEIDNSRAKETSV